MRRVSRLNLPDLASYFEQAMPLRSWMITILVDLRGRDVVLQSLMSKVSRRPRIALGRVFAVANLGMV